VHHGNPVEQILQMADRIDADLIVLGSHGKGKLKYAFLGSVAEKVLRKTLRPAMVVPLR
jgi:nucleotide-binding universal stress UspA family protein